MPPTATTDAPRPTPTEVRERLLTLGGELYDMESTAVEARSDAWHARAHELRTTIDNLDRALTGMERGETPVVETRSAGPIAATRRIGDPEARSLGLQVVESQEYREFAGRGCRDSFVEVRTLIDSDSSGSPYAGLLIPVQPLSVEPRSNRVERFRVRDLLPNSTTTLPAFQYVQETYTTGTDATFVAEGSVKPEVAMAWALKNGVAETVAAWIPVTRQVLADAPLLRGQIDNRLRYKLDYAVDDALVNGDGNAPNIKGILTYSDKQSQDYSTDALTSIALAIAKVENVDLEATGIVMNSTYFWTIMAANNVATAAAGNGPFAGPPGTIWGLPVARSRRVAAKKAIVGDFRTSAEVVIREDVTIRLGEQHDTYFIYNKVAILAEMRLAFPVYRPDGFVETAIAS